MDLILFYIYIKLPLYTIGKFTRILITLGIAPRHMAEGTARHTEQSLILREKDTDGGRHAGDPKGWFLIAMESESES